MKACIPETALETKRPIPYEIGRCQECLVQKYPAITRTPNPRGVSKARQRRSTWLRNPHPLFVEGLMGVHFPYSCGTAPDFHRLRLFSPGIRTMGTSGVIYSIVRALRDRLHPQS